MFPILVLYNSFIVLRGLYNILHIMYLLETIYIIFMIVGWLELPENGINYSSLEALFILCTISKIIVREYLI